MKKIAMREYLVDLETRIDEMLKKWKKVSRVENGEVVQIVWQFEQSFIAIDIYWLDGDEAIEIECKRPRMKTEHKWRGLTLSTLTRVMDRVGNFAQIVHNVK